MIRTAILLSLLAVPAFAQGPSQGGTANRQPAPAIPPPVPLPQWFVDIDTTKKGEVSRADFLKHRMRRFDDLDDNKDGKLSADELIRSAESPFSRDVAGGTNLEERRDRARAEFQELDTNRDGFVDRAEAEAAVHTEFNTYDTDRDNRITEAEIRLIVLRSMQQQAIERQQMEAHRRQGMLALGEFIDMQLRDADRLDKNNDGKISQQEYLVLAGPADGQQVQGALPYDVRRQLVMPKFREIDTNKDNMIDRVELTAYAVRQFLAMDLNNDRFLNEEELKKAQEADAARMRETIEKLLSRPPAPARPAPPVGRQPQPAPATPPGLPQGR